MMLQIKLGISPNHCGENEYKLETLNHEQRTLPIRLHLILYIIDAGAKAHMEFSDLNAGIMDYLISEGYPSAAQKFAHEANIAAMLDVESIQERVEIREAIDAGDIQTAITKINEFNPRVSHHLCLLQAPRLSHCYD